MHGQTRNYFTLPSLAWMVNIILWFYGGVYGAAFFPHLLPYNYIGPAGSVIKLVLAHSQYGPHFVLVAGTLAHVSEAVYSWNVCTSKGIVGSARIKWFISTAIFGGTSLYELVRFSGYSQTTTSRFTD